MRVIGMNHKPIKVEEPKTPEVKEEIKVEEPKKSFKKEN